MIYRGLQLKTLFVLKSAAAFAIIAKRQRFGWAGPMDAQLVFLYTSPELRGAGNAERLIEDIRETYLDGGGMTLLCCGSKRRAFFAAHGFRVIDEHDGQYEMQYQIATQQ